MQASSKLDGSLMHAAAAAVAQRDPARASTATAAAAGTVLHSNLTAESRQMFALLLSLVKAAGSPSSLCEVSNVPAAATYLAEQSLKSGAVLGEYYQYHQLQCMCSAAPWVQLLTRCLLQAAQDLDRAVQHGQRNTLIISGLVCCTQRIRQQAEFLIGCVQRCSCSSGAPSGDNVAYGHMQVYAEATSDASTSTRQCQQQHVQCDAASCVLSVLRFGQLCYVQLQKVVVAAAPADCLMGLVQAAQQEKSAMHSEAGSPGAAYCAVTAPGDDDLAHLFVRAVKELVGSAALEAMKLYAASIHQQQTCWSCCSRGTCWQTCHSTAGCSSSRAIGCSFPIAVLLR